MTLEASWIADANKYHKIMLEELRIWRAKYPRVAFDVHEEAKAKVEGRKPVYQPPQAFG